MPAAKLGLDIVTRKFFDSNGAVLSNVNAKANSIVDFQLAITQDDIPIAFPPGTTVTVAIKNPSAPAGPPYLYEEEAVASGWGTGSRWFFRLNLTGDDFTAVLGKTTDFEVLIISPDGQRIPSLTLALTIQKHVIVP